LTISAKRAKRTRDDLPVLRELGNRLIEKGSLKSALITGIFGQSPVRPPERRQDFPGMAGFEEINQGAVLALEQSDLQPPHKPTGGEPEIIPHQHNRLNMLAITVPESGDELCVRFTPPGMKPLLVLIEDQEHLAPGWQDAAPSQICQRLNEPESSGQLRASLA
jgi:hypothetical protein